MVRDRYKNESQQFFCDDDGKTQGEFKDECDINRIMARFLKTGVVPVNTAVARYGDFSAVSDYQQAMEIVRNAKLQFQGLPSRARDKFRNDPAEFLRFIADPKNVDEMQEYGFLSEEASKRRTAAKDAAEKARIATEVAKVAAASAVPPKI